MKRWQEIIKRLVDKNNIYKDYVKGAEIGVERGKNTRALLSHPIIKELTCVDTWRYDKDYAETAKHKDTSNKYHYKNFEEFLKLASQFPSKIRIYTTHSHIAAKIIPNDYFDFVFIDANHSYENVKRDIRVWRHKVKHGGFLCGHDWGDRRFPGVEKAVKEAFPTIVAPECQWTFELGGDYTWFALRP